MVLRCVEGSEIYDPRFHFYLELFFRNNSVDFRFLEANCTHSIHFPGDNSRDHFFQIACKNVPVDVNDRVGFLGPGITEAAERKNQYEAGFELRQAFGF